MSDISPGATRVETPADFGKGDAGEIARWQSEIRLAEKEHERWRTKGRKIERRYRDEQLANQAAVDDRDVSTRFNILWSNVQTLLPALYSFPPKPVVERAFQDRDPIGRAAATILQRAIEYEIRRGTLHRAMRQATLDYLLPGRGQIWVSYEAEFEAVEPEDSGESEGPGTEAPADPATPKERVTEERINTDYVQWEDFLTSPARVWEETRWVARRVFMTRDDLIERFGKEKGGRVPLDYKPANIPEGQLSTPEYEVFQRAIVWEIWDKPSKTVIWVAPSWSEGVLDKKPDFANLRGFFPCPRPLAATETNGTTIPVADYVQYQDQARELDDLTGRVGNLAKVIRLAGAYDASHEELKRLCTEGDENQLVPVEGWQAFAEKGGLKGAIDFLPMAEAAAALMKLYEARAQVKNDLYEITGISDIIRGQGNASETATAQRIKGQFATLRLDDRQREVQRFARDVIALMGELLAEHVAPETLAQMSGWLLTEQAQASDQPAAPPMPPSPMQPQGMMMAPPPGMTPASASPGAANPGAPAMSPPMGAPLGPQGPGAPTPPMTPEMKFAAAVALLKNDRDRGFRIEIETDSTIATDEQADKQARIEFLTAAGGFITQAIEAAGQAPQLAPLLGKMLLFGVRGFKAGRELEGAFEDAVDKMDQKARAIESAPPPPNPEQMKAQAEAERTKIDAQVAQAEAQAKMQALQLEAQIAAQEHQFKMQEMQIGHAIAMQELHAKVAAAQAMPPRMTPSPNGAMQ